MAFTQNSQEKYPTQRQYLPSQFGPPQTGPPTSPNYGAWQYQPPVQNVRDMPTFRPGNLDFSDTEGDSRFLRTFDNSVIRAKFIRKVYTILTLQLAFSTAFTIPFLIIDEVQEFATNYFYLIIGGLLLFVVPYFILICCEGTRRVYPLNIILLFLLTLGMSVIIAFTTAKLDTEIVFVAFLTTVVVTLSITILAIFCPFDITSCGMVLCVLTMIVVIYGFFAVIYGIITNKGSKILHLVFSGLAVVLFSLYLMFETQAIMGGRRMEISPEEHIYAAVQLYVDIAYIFIHLLQLIGACMSSE